MFFLVGVSLKVKALASNNRSTVGQSRLLYMHHFFGNGNNRAELSISFFGGGH